MNKTQSIAIIGQGNVAIDVSRILLSPIEKLSNTDITKHALAALSESIVEKVYLVGRRGPLQAAFTIKELREMTKLPEVNINWRSDDFLGVTDELASLPRPRKRMTELMLTSLAAQQQRSLNTKKEFLPVFLRSPESITNENHLKLTINQLVGGNAVHTACTELLKTNLVLRSIGYKSISVDSELNFNESKGYVNNHGGKFSKNFFFYKLF